MQQALIKLVGDLEPKASVNMPYFQTIQKHVSRLSTHLGAR